MVFFRAPIYAAFLAVVIGSGLWAILTIRFGTEFLPILPASLPSVQGLTDFALGAAGKDEIYAVVDPMVQGTERQELLATARTALSAAPGVERVVAPGEIAKNYAGALGAWILLNSPPEIFARATGAFSPDVMAKRLEEIPERLAGAIDPAQIVQMQFDPLGVLESLGGERGDQSAFGSMGMDAGFLIITPDHYLENTAQDTAMTEALRSALDQAFSEHERGKVLLTGNPVFNAEISRQMQRDVGIMVGAALILLIASFYAFYRTWRPLGWILFFQILAMLCGIVAARILYGELNVISIGFASILLGVGMDYSVLVYHYYASSDRNNAAVWYTLRRGIWFSALVTASSFFMLGFSSFPALRQLAVLVGVGLLSTALMATWLLRAVLRDYPPRAPRVLSIASNGTASWVMRHKGLLTGIAVALAVTLILSRPWTYTKPLYSPSLEDMRPIGSMAFRAQEWLGQLDPSSGDAIYVLRGATHDAIRAAVVPLEQAVRPGQKGSAAWLVPSESNVAANLSSWSENTSARLQEAFERAGVGEDWSEITLQLARVLDATKRGDADAFSQVNSILRALAGSDERGKFAFLRVPHAANHPIPAGGLAGIAPDVEVYPVSWVSLTKELMELAQHDFEYLGIAMLIAIIVLCTVAQRSWRMVLLNLTALVLALCLFIGLLRIVGLSLTPLSLISIPLLVGLVIDYSLHILMTLEEQRGDLHKTYRYLAAPVVLTGLSGCIGFGVPALTGQPALTNFGLVMDIGIISAVVACLLFLPVLYLWGVGKDYRQRKFYRVLYRRRSFELILFGWRLLGKTGAWLISRTFGLGYALTHFATVRTVRRNMAMLDPQKATYAAACRLFINQGENFSSYGRLAREEPQAVLQMIGEARGFEYLERARKEGRGCVLVTGHLGFFELGGLVLAQMGFTMAALTLPEPGDGLTEWRADFRARWGVRTIVIGQETFAFLDAVRALQEGTLVASLADRPYDDNSVDIALPHGGMKFATGSVLLALLAGCPIIPVAILRDPHGTYRMDACDYIEPTWLPEGREETLRHYTEKIAASLVPIFIKWPEQWFQFSPVDAAPVVRGNKRV